MKILVDDSVQKTFVPNRTFLIIIAIIAIIFTGIIIYKKFKDQ